MRRDGDDGSAAAASAAAAAASSSSSSSSSASASVSSSDSDSGSGSTGSSSSSSSSDSSAGSSSASVAAADATSAPPHHGAAAAAAPDIVVVPASSGLSADSEGDDDDGDGDGHGDTVSGGTAPQPQPKQRLDMRAGLTQSGLERIAAAAAAKAVRDAAAAAATSAAEEDAEEEKDAEEEDEKDHRHSSCSEPDASSCDNSSCDGGAVTASSSSATTGLGSSSQSSRLRRHQQRPHEHSDHSRHHGSRRHPGEHHGGAQQQRRHHHHHHHHHHGGHGGRRHQHHQRRRAQGAEDLHPHRHGRGGHLGHHGHRHHRSRTQLEAAVATAAAAAGVAGGAGAGAGDAGGTGPTTPTAGGRRPWSPRASGEHGHGRGKADFVMRRSSGAWSPRASGDHGEGSSASSAAAAGAAAAGGSGADGRHAAMASPPTSPRASRDHGRLHPVATHDGVLPAVLPATPLALRGSIDMLAPGGVPGRHRRHLREQQSHGFLHHLRDTLAEAFPPVMQHDYHHTHHNPSNIDLPELHEDISDDVVVVDVDSEEVGDTATPLAGRSHRRQSDADAALVGVAAAAVGEDDDDDDDDDDEIEGRRHGGHAHHQHHHHHHRRRHHHHHRHPEDKDGGSGNGSGAVSPLALELADDVVIVDGSDDRSAKSGSGDDDASGGRASDSDSNGGGSSSSELSSPSSSGSSAARSSSSSSSSSVSSSPSSSSSSESEGSGGEGRVMSRSGRRRRQRQVRDRESQISMSDLRASTSSGMGPRAVGAHYSRRRRVLSQENVDASSVVRHRRQHDYHHHHGHGHGPSSPGGRHSEDLRRTAARGASMEMQRRHGSRQSDATYHDDGLSDGRRDSGAGVGDDSHGGHFQSKVARLHRGVGSGGLEPPTSPARLSTSGGLARRHAHLLEANQADGVGTHLLHVELGVEPHEHRTPADLAQVGLGSSAMIEMELHGFDVRTRHEEVLLHEAIMEDDVARKLQYTVAHSNLPDALAAAEELAEDLEPRRDMDEEEKHAAHIAEVLSMLTIIRETGIVLLDIPGWDTDEFADQLLDELVLQSLLPPQHRDAAFLSVVESEQQFPHAIGNGYDMLTGFVPHLPGSNKRGVSLSFARLKNQVNLEAPDSVPTRFVFLLLISNEYQSAHSVQDLCEAVTFLMSEEEFHCAALEMETKRRFFKEVEAFVERMENIDDVARFHHVGEHILFEPEELVTKWTGTPGKGLWLDLKGRYPLYLSDLTDVVRRGNKIRALSAVLFLFFACLAPALTLGELTSELTGGAIGLTEMLVSTAVGMAFYSLLSAQPLIIVGGTGPILIMMGAVYDLCLLLGIPFLPAYAWTGLWCGLFCAVAAVFEASVLIHFCTRFTDEIFEQLVALVFIIETYKHFKKLFYYAGTSVSAAIKAEKAAEEAGVTVDYALWSDANERVAIALESLILAAVVFFVYVVLRSVRSTAYLAPRLREFVSDFSAFVAIGAAAATAAWIRSFSDVDVARPKVDKFEPTYCVKGPRAERTAEAIAKQELPSSTALADLDCDAKRGWVVDLLPDDFPVWAIFAAMLPALLTFVLLFLEHNIAQRLINRADHKLSKPVGYHLDMLVLGALTAGLSLFGLPWIVAGSVRSMSHLRALSHLEEWTVNGKTRERVVSVREQRVTGLAIALLIGLLLFQLDVLQVVPTPAFLGLFFSMGVVALASGQLWDRLKLIFVQPSLFPPSHYSRRVPPLAIHAYTFIQLVLLSLLMAVKLIPEIGLVFPLGLALLIPIRLFLLPRLFAEEHIEALDSDEDPDDDIAVEHVI